MFSTAFQHLLILACGFAFAGILASGYHIVTARPASFRMLGAGIGRLRWRAMPFLAFAAPFLIMRNILRARGAHSQRFLYAMIATVVAGYWSLACGALLLMTLRAAAGLI
ncbi:MAG: hypothetical protein AB7K04_00510 [Pseudorhodoplanes sp.]